MRSVSRKLWPILFVFVCGAARVCAQETAEGVRVSLSLAEGKSIYRMGEPVRLVLSFTSEREGLHVDITTTKPASSVDEIILSPEAGVHAWLEEFTGGQRYSPDHSAMSPLSSKPTRVELPLNDLYRFDRPGRYSVRVKTHRASRAAAQGSGIHSPLVTNEVSFEIVPMSEAEEEREVKRLVAALDASKNWQEEARAAEELSYLAGTPSTREKVRLLVNRQGRTGNYSQNLYYGLFIAHDRALVLRLLEAALRDPAVEVTHQLLNTVTTVRSLQDGPRARSEARVHVGMVMEQEPPRITEIRQEYLRELAASLPRRTGKSMTRAAMTVLTNLPKEPAQSAALLSAAREILLREFDNIHPFDQEYLLRVYWEKLRDASFLPVLERMLTKNREPQSYQIRTAALNRLMELNADRARAFVIAELRDPASFVDFDVLSALEDATLPEADDALLTQIRAFGSGTSNGDFVRLRHKTLLAARYASPAIYDGLLEAYQKWGAKWQTDAKGAVLSYLARYNEAQAAPLIEQALAQTSDGQDLSFLIELTRSHYSNAVHALLCKRLEEEDPQAVGTAGYIMAKGGPAEGRELIEARLKRWLKEWTPRATELNAPDANAEMAAQRMVEINLVEALLRAKSWKLTDEEAERLKRGCITQRCREHYQVR